MCFRVECRTCGKYSWTGCGKHLASIYANIESGKHCMCKSWPGVVIPADNPGNQQQQPPAATSATPEAGTANA